jgi:hypothetical protein
MNSLKVLQDRVFKEAKESLGDDLIDIAIGGSALYKAEPNDLDVILLVHQVIIEQIRDFYRKTHYSISVLTEMQLKSNIQWSVKVATMIFKGARFRTHKTPVPTSAQLKELTKRGLAEEIAFMERKMIEGNLSADKAFGLLRQKALLCL